MHRYKKSINITSTKEKKWHRRDSPLCARDSGYSVNTFIVGYYANAQLLNIDCCCRQHLILVDVINRTFNVYVKFVVIGLDWSGDACGYYE